MGYRGADGRKGSHGSFFDYASGFSKGDVVGAGKSTANERHFVHVIAGFLYQKWQISWLCFQASVFR